MTNVIDLCFVVDITGSMQVFVDGLRRSLVEIIALSKLIGVSSIGILTYKDYSDDDMIKWSGWSNEYNGLLTFIENIKIGGGDDYPEAAKTAAYKLINDIIKNETIIIWITDSPPHISSREHVSNIKHLNAEKEYLGEMFDWVKLSREFVKKNCHVFPLIYSENPIVMSIFHYISYITDGIAMYIPNSEVRERVLVGYRYQYHIRKVPPSSSKIAHTLIDILMNIAGEDTSTSVRYVQELRRINNDLDNTIRNENDILKIEWMKTISKCNTIIHKPLQSIKENINTYITHHDNHHDFIYNVFHFILKESNNPMILTYNPLFGKYWRYICRQRKDERREMLLQYMSMIMTNFTSEHDKNAFQKFLEESYKQHEYIQNILKTIGNNDKVFVLDIDDKYPLKHMSVRDIMDLSRQCTIKTLSDIMGHLKLVPYTNDIVEKYGRYIPICDDIFKCISHLLVDGIVFSKRPSMILALIAVYTQNIILKEKAVEYLISCKGNWIDMTMPENYCYNFIRLALYVPCAFTEDELHIFHKYHITSGILRHKYDTIDIQTGYVSRNTVRPDYKSICKQCGQYRSFTIMNKEGVCGLCICECDFIEDTRVDTSTWYECRSCLSHYTITGKLGVSEPKCHFCRSNTSVPNVICNSCGNRFVSESNVEDDFTCPQCVIEPRFETYSVPLKDFLCQNTVTLSNVTFKVTNDFFTSPSLYKCLEHIDYNVIQKSEYTFKKKNIIHTENVLRQIEQKIALETVESKTCSLCFEEFMNKDIFPVCGREQCKNSVCRTCAISWYGKTRQGQLITTSHLYCPFCKKTPTTSVLRKTNKAVCSMKRPKEIDESMVYGWCQICGWMKESHERRCGEEGHRMTNEFRCDDCQGDKGTTHIKQSCQTCPNCGVMTEKTSGCNHIKCTACQTHWCFECGEAFEEDTIYIHMMQAHGSYGFDNDMSDYGSDYGGSDDNDDYNNWYDGMNEDAINDVYNSDNDEDY